MVVFYKVFSKRLSILLGLVFVVLDKVAIVDGNTDRSIEFWLYFSKCFPSSIATALQRLVNIVS